jgi:ankyrin repeat protein
MKKTCMVLGSLALCVLLAGRATWTVASFHPEIDVEHVQKDLLGRTVEGWTFQDFHHTKVNILNANYNEDIASVHVSTKSGQHGGLEGRSGELRLAYEWVSNDWKLLVIEPLSFTKMEYRDVCKFDVTGDHPLLEAVYEGDVDLVSSLIASGADVNTVNDNGFPWTPLIIAADRGNVSVAKTLIANGAEIDYPEASTLRTPLVVAARDHQPEMVNFLLANGANVNHSDGSGRTALMYAARCWEPKAVPIAKALLDADADVSIRDKDGMTALDLARDCRYPEIAELFKEALAIRTGGSDETSHIPESQPPSSTNATSVGKNMAMVSNFDIKGIRLGMNVTNVKHAFPQITFQERTDYRKKNSAERFTGGAGTGWGMISDWNVYVSITDEPYGSGAYYMHYKKFFNEKIDGVSFLQDFRKDLVGKYGNPTCENRSQNGSYFACWGTNCSENMSERPLHDKSRQYRALYDNKIQNGKYLIVTFENNPFLQEVKFSLFDTNPYYVQIQQKRKSEIERSRQKIDF